MHFGKRVRARSSRAIAPIDLIFYTRSDIPVAWSSSKMIWIGICILAQEFIGR